MSPIHLEATQTFLVISICILNCFLFSVPLLWSLEPFPSETATNDISISFIHRSQTHVPAASMKGRLRRKVRRGSLRFLRKSLRRPVMAWISSTLLSTGTVLPRRNFSFSSFTVRSAPDRRYSPAWEGGNTVIHHLGYHLLNGVKKFQVTTPYQIHNFLCLFSLFPN